jgi:very-short-patch-repair endonuclease
VLASAGYRVLRVAEQDVLSALAQVVARIRQAIEEAG